MKKPLRKTVRAKQQHISHLQHLASLEKYYPQYRISGVQPDGSITVEQEKDPWEEREPKSIIESLEWREIQEKLTVAMAYGVKISLAACTLKRLFGDAEAAALAGIEAGDLQPLTHHLSLIGPTLLAAPRLVPYIHDWWRGAKAGNKECAQNFNAVLAALTPGPGPWRTTSKEKKRQQARERKQTYRKNNSAAFGKLSKKIMAEINNLPNKVWRNPKLLSIRKDEIKTRLISEASQSANAATQRAAKKAKGLKDRGLL